MIGCTNHKNRLTVGGDPDPHMDPNHVNTSLNIAE